MPKKLDHVVVNKEFGVAEALSSIQFYWNLAKRNNRVVIVEIWSAPNEVQAPPRPALSQEEGQKETQEVSVGHHQDQWNS